MATAAERKALIFLAAVACLGLGARLVRGRGDAALLAAGQSGAPRAALDAQIEAAAAAHTHGAAGRTRRASGASGNRGTRARGRPAAADSLDAFDSTARRTRRAASTAPAPRRRSRGPALDSAAQLSDAWASRPVVTSLDAGGFGTVRAGPPPASDTASPSKPRRRRRAKPKP